MVEAVEGGKEGVECNMTSVPKEGEMEIEVLSQPRGGTRQVLKEVDQNMMQETTVKIEMPSKGYRNAWKMVNIGKRKGTIQNKEHNKENQQVHRLKRTRSVGEWKEELNNRSKW